METGFKEYVYLSGKLKRREFISMSIGLVFIGKLDSIISEAFPLYGESYFTLIPHLIILYISFAIYINRSRDFSGTWLYAIPKIILSIILLVLVTFITELPESLNQIGLVLIGLNFLMFVIFASIPTKKIDKEEENLKDNNLK